LTQTEAARKIGIDKGVLNAMECLRYDPIYGFNNKGFNNNKRYNAGTWKDPVLKVCNFYHADPEYIFPNNLHQLKNRDLVITGNVSDLPDYLITNENESLLPKPDQVLMLNEAHDAIANALMTLTPREEKVLRMRFGFGEERSYTREEIAKDFAVSGNRIQQIESVAIRKLRHPQRGAKLRCSRDLSNIDEDVKSYHLDTVHRKNVND